MYDWKVFCSLWIFQLIIPNSNFNNTTSIMLWLLQNKRRNTYYRKVNVNLTAINVGRWKALNLFVWNQTKLMALTWWRSNQVPIRNKYSVGCNSYSFSSRLCFNWFPTHKLNVIQSNCPRLGYGLNAQLRSSWLMQKHKVVYKCDVKSLVVLLLNRCIILNKNCQYSFISCIHILFSCKSWKCRSLHI